MLRNHIARLLLALCCLICQLRTFPQEGWTAYTKDNGIAFGTINVHLFDRSGNLWLGTKNGLWVFDGKNWTNIRKIDNLETRKSEPIGNIDLIFEDSRGDKWIGSDINTFVYSKGYWIDFVEQGLANYPPVRIMEDRNGYIWICSELLEKTIKEANATPIPVINGSLNVFTGQFWVCYDMDVGGAQLIKSGEEAIYFTALLEDRRGRVWVGTIKGLDKHDSTGWVKYTNSEIRSVLVNTVMEDSKGNIWAGTSYGISRYDGTNWKNFTRDDGVGGGSVRKIYEDKTGRIWAFFYRNQRFTGLGMFDGKSWQMFSDENGLPRGSVTWLTDDGYGDVWALTTKGIALYSWKEWTIFNKKNGLGEEFYAALVDSQNHIWIGTDAGIFTYSGNQWKQVFNPKAGDATFEMTVFLEDSTGCIWAGTAESGIFRIEGDKVGHYDNSSGIADNSIKQIFQGKDGAIWVVSKKGISRRGAGEHKQ
jgi:ligand-binding sensor domain-containing protein